MRREGAPRASRAERALDRLPVGRGPGAERLQEVAGVLAPDRARPELGGTAIGQDPEPPVRLERKADVPDARVDAAAPVRLRIPRQGRREQRRTSQDEHELDSQGGAEIRLIMISFQSRSGRDSMERLPATAETAARAIAGASSGRVESGARRET